MNLIKIQQVADDIKTITIQGATNIAKAALEVMISELSSQKFASIDALSAFVQQ
jgi:translation initiation factor 2B subunit (eIF-2B alpha/beta/delta family)